MVLPWSHPSIVRPHTTNVAICSSRSSRSYGDTTNCNSRRNMSSASSSSSSVAETRKDALTSSDGVVGCPIDFDIASSIEGKESQVR